MSVAVNSKKEHSSFLNFIPKFRRTLRTFHHTLDSNSPEFFIDSIDDQPGFYQMTSQGPRLRIGQSIEVEQSGQYQTYQVDDIEFYNEPSDIWTAVLHRI